MKAVRLAASPSEVSSSPSSTFPPPTSLPAKSSMESAFAMGERVVEALNSSSGVRAVQGVARQWFAFASTTVDRTIPASLRREITRMAAPFLRRYVACSARQGSVLVFGIAAVVVLGLLLTLSSETLTLLPRQSLASRSRYLIEGGGGASAARASAADCARAISCEAGGAPPEPACAYWDMRLHRVPADGGGGLRTTSASRQTAAAAAVEIPLATWAQMRGEAVWALHFRRGCRGSAFPLYVPNSQVCGAGRAQWRAAGLTPTITASAAAAAAAVLPCSLRPRSTWGRRPCRPCTATARSRSWHMRPTS